MGWLCVHHKSDPSSCFLLTPHGSLLIQDFCLWVYFWAFRWLHLSLTATHHWLVLYASMLLYHYIVHPFMCSNRQNLSSLSELMRAWNSLRLLKIQLVKAKKSYTFVLPIFYPCIYKVRAKLSVWTGLKWGKFLLHIMYWTYVISHDACKYSARLKNLC